jgi:phosphohistidine swiveling domain-containing protein
MTTVKLWDITPGYDLIEEVDVPEMHSWFLDMTHSVPPQTPLFAWFWTRYCSHGLQYASDYFSFPTCRGSEMRNKNGYSYNAFHIVRDEEEVKRREVKFRQAMRPWVENFDGLWEGYKKKLLDMYEKLKAVDVDKASNIELYQHNCDLIDAYKTMFEIHFLGMQSSYNGWVMFETICKERFGITDQDPQFQEFFGGFDSKVYQVDKQLSEFAQIANEMGLANVFKENEAKVIIPKLEQTKKGQEWLKKFYDFLQVEGWRMVRMNDFTDPYWLEEPSVPLNIVKQFTVVSYDLDEARKKLTKKREEAVQSLLQKLHPDEKDGVKLLIKLAQRAGTYSEEHDLYCELYMHALLRRGYMAIGRRLAQSRTIDKPDDVFFVNPDEIGRAIVVPEHHDLRFITKRRRAEWEEAKKMSPPPVITDRGSMEEAVGRDLLPTKDAILVKLIIGELPTVKPELKADLYGLRASKGIAEGTARVVMYYGELEAVKAGEILVCPTTNPAWIPVFSLIKGIVTDGGGLLSHAAIVARDYGIPAVVNTREATTKIKTGQKIRVDANEGAVFILDK